MLPRPPVLPQLVLSAVLLLGACAAPDDGSAPLADQVVGSVADDSARPADVEGLLAGLAEEGLSGDELIAELYRGALEEGPLVQYGTQNSPAAETWVPAFEAAFPGLELEYQQMRTTDIPDRVIAEAEAGRPLADVVVATAPVLAVLEDRGLLSAGLPLLAPEGFDPAFVAERSLSAWVQPYAIVWNTETAGFASSPTGWDDLLQADHAGCTMGDGALSWLGWMVGTRGEDGLRDWVTGLRANGGAMLAGMGGSARLAVLAAGEIDCIADVTLPSVLRVLGDGAPVAWTVPDGAPAAIGGFAILRGTSRPYTAALLVAWGMGPEGAALINEAALPPTNSAAVPPAPAYREWLGPGGTFGDRITVPDAATVLDRERRASALLPELIAQFTD